MIRRLQLLPLRPQQQHRSFFDTTVPKITPKCVEMNRMLLGTESLLQKPLLLSSLLSLSQLQKAPTIRRHFCSTISMSTQHRQVRMIRINNNIQTHYYSPFQQQPPPLVPQHQRQQMRTLQSSSSLFLSLAKPTIHVLPTVSTPPMQIRTFANHRHKRMLKYTKGYRGRSKNCFSIAIRRLQKAWQYAYRDRKTKKRIWRTMWIQRIQAGARQYSVRYSRFIRSLKYTDIQLNRKVLSELAATEPFTFKAIIDVTRFQQQQYDSKHLQQQQQQKLRLDQGSNDDEGNDEFEVMTPSEKVA